MKTTVAQLTHLVKGKLSGNGKTIITGFAGVNEARLGDITFITNSKFLNRLVETRASATLMPDDIKNSIHLPTIRVKHPDIAFAKIVEYFSPPSIQFSPGIHPTAIISEKVKLDKDVSIQPYVVIQSGSKIGAKTIVYPNVYIGHKVTIGTNCLIYPNVVIREGTIIGNNVIIHSGTVIGSDGFGYTQIGEKRYKIPQNGIVVIEDDVEIGANVTIDRARFNKTIIGKGTKIDNLVHIAHNVIVGENSVIVAQVGISGSTRLGKNVTLAGQVGTVGHISIGDNVVVAGRSVVTKNIPSNMIVSGFPAQPHKKQLHLEACIRKLPEIYRELKNKSKQ